jgi:predicted Holliday junction resolvase-like endonuclease
MEFSMVLELIVLILIIIEIYSLVRHAQLEHRVEEHMTELDEHIRQLDKHIVRLDTQQSVPVALPVDEVQEV